MQEVTLDFEFFRKQFPFFETEKSQEWSFFDNAGGSFPCRQVIDKLAKFYIENKVQPYPQNALACAAYDQLNEGRQVMADILGVPEPTLTLGASSTQNFNTLAAACVGYVGENDEIICSEQDHEANIGGWERAAKNARATFSLWPVNSETGELEVETLKEMVSEKTKVISLTHCSNMIGTINPIKEILELAKSVGAKLILDGVSYAPHSWPNILELGVDAYGFSTYKTYGTHQGVLYVKESFMQELKVQSHYFYDDTPSYRLNSSGHDHACVAALSGLGDFIETLHKHHFGKSDDRLYDKAQAVSKILLAYENSLCERFLDELTKLPVKIYGKKKMEGRESNISFIPENISPTELTEKLAARGIALSLSHFDCVRMFNRLGLDLDKAALRVSFAPYNSKEDLDKLISAIKESL